MCQQDIYIHRLAKEVDCRLAMTVSRKEVLLQTMIATTKITRALKDAKITLGNATVAATQERKVRAEND